MNRKKGCPYGNSLIPSSLFVATKFYYLILVVSVLVVSDGLGILVVVSTGIDAAVSVPMCWVAVSLIGGDVVSDPVDFSGVSQPIVANAKKAMKRMLLMRNNF